MNTPPPRHGIDRTPIRFLVLAGNLREVHNWQDENEIPQGAALYVSGPEMLRGMQFKGDEVDVAVIGTFHLRKDAIEILDVMKTVFV